MRLLKKLIICIILNIIVMEYILQLIHQRISNWKSFYASHCENFVDPRTTSWVRILEQLKLSYDDGIFFCEEAYVYCGLFSYEESSYLRQLPYYNYIKDFISNFDKRLAKITPNENDNIYIARYPRGYREPDRIPTFVATIVCKTPVDFEDEILVCILNKYSNKVIKHLVIRYANKAPADFIEYFIE